MIRTCVTCVVLVAGLILTAQPCLSQDKPKAKDAATPPAQAKPADAKPADAPAATCPVCSKPIDKKQSAKYQGKPVYFCCDKCKATFDENPSKYEAAVKAQWAAMAPLSVQVKCPGTMKPVNAKISVEGDHGPVYFCCPSCKAAWEKDSTKMKAKLADCYTYQTLCPVMGEAIDPTISVEKNGKTIYLCCSDCIKEFDKDAAKFTANVEEQVKKNKAAAEKAHGK